jgi:hypothetical protein
MAGKRHGQRRRRRQRARKERPRQDGRQPLLERDDAREARQVGDALDAARAAASDAITDVELLEELAEADRAIVLHPPLLHGDERVQDFEGSSAG